MYKRQPYAVLLGVTAGLLNFVPVVGYWISLILALFVAITLSLIHI